jgi:glycosyltransferase involved in cell wall biosynthesis
VKAATPLILTFNEAPNLRRTLERLDWAKEIVIVDSFSTDETLAIAQSFPQVRVVKRKFDNHTAQWNFGIEQCKTDWVLALDADYVLSDELAHELRGFQAADGADAYFARFSYCVHGRPLRGTLYPPRAVLFRRERCRYEPDGHTQLLRVSGKSALLRGRIFHDDRKPLERWLANQTQYAKLEARHLMDAPPSKLNNVDRIRRKIILAPALVCFHALIGKGLILDGWPGWYYAFQRTVVELLVSLELMMARWGNRSAQHQKTTATWRKSDERQQ